MTHEDINKLQILFGDNFIGPEQVNKLLSMMDLSPLAEEDIPKMNYSEDVLIEKSKEYLLVMGYSGKDITPLNILNFREVFGFNPEKREPCFYNQDWYLCEDFINTTLEKRWYLIKKDVFEQSRSVLPETLIAKENINFPSAILCVYTFFAMYFSVGEYLWYHDFIWCSDKDHNGDRIYVGKYNDVDGINKNGFSIHRHLSLRPCYASVTII